MIKYMQVSIGIFLALAASRFIPHPPNFTSLIALSFYVPVLLGVKFIPAIVVCFVVTDLFLGFHGTLLFTWGSVFLISLISRNFCGSISVRFLGVLTACVIFFIITNFGVWTLGSYGYTFEGLITCYILAIPFFGNTLISSFVYSMVIELVWLCYKYFYRIHFLK